LIIHNISKEKIMQEIEELSPSMADELLNFLQFLKNKRKVKDYPKNYDFSDLVGKLQWKGDAVSEQRKLRDEW